MISEDIEELAFEIAVWMQGLDEPLPPLSEHAHLTGQLCEQLRALGIMVLLGSGNADRFQHNLIRSARLRLAFLQRCAAEGAADAHDFVAGILEPLHDAMAAGDWPLAQALTRATPAEYRPGHEYEDDHWHALVLRSLLAEPADPAAQQDALERLARALDDPEHHRVAVLRALATKDAAAFDGAFELLLDLRESEIAEEVQRGGLASPSTLARRHVFVEGLALLRLAARAGIATAADYRLCPALARVPMREPVPPDD